MRIIVYSLSLIVIFFALAIYDIRYTIYAVDSTPSADVKLQLEQLKIEIASKAAKFKEEVNRKLKDKAYIGKVIHPTSTTITIASKTGPKIINITQDTEYISRVKGKKFSLKLLAEDDYIAGLGDVDETGVLTARAIVLLDPKTYTLNPKIFLWGQVMAIDKLLTLKDRENKYVSVSGVNLKITDEGDIVILTGFMKAEVFEAKTTFVIKEASPSSKEATKSAN